MKRRWEAQVMSIALVGSALLAVGATIRRSPDVSALLREGDAQYAAGAFAAAAELSGLTVLHVDKDFELIAEVTGQPLDQLVLPDD